MHEELYEKMAAVQHDIWASWMEWQFGLCKELKDGSLLIPADWVEHWQRQTETDYEDLTPEEKASDREQVDKIIRAVGDLEIGRIG